MGHIEEPLQYEFSLTPNQQSGWGDYVTSFKGRARGWDEDLDDERQVGVILGQKINLAAAHFDGVDRAALLESITPDILDFSRAVLDRDGRCPAQLPVRSADKSGRCPCLVYIEVIEVEPDFRGNEIGTGLLQHFADVAEIDNCLIGLKAYPLSKDYGSERRPEDIERVRHFYERLGFARGPSDYMLKDASQCKSAIKRRKGQEG